MMIARMAALEMEEIGWNRNLFGHGAARMDVGMETKGVTREGSQEDPHVEDNQAISKMDHFMEKIRLCC